MIIKSIDIFHASDGTRNNIFIEIVTNDGIVGTGECYSIGPDKSVISFIEEIRPWFIGEDPSRIEWLLKRAKNNLRFPLGQVGWSALSGIDIALWDIMGKDSNQPVYSLLGGATRNKVRVYHAIYGDSPEEVGNNTLSLMEEGYTAFKTSPLPSYWRTINWLDAVKEADKRLSIIRSIIGDEVDLAVDFHTSIPEPSKSIELSNTLSNYNLMFIEEPARADFVKSSHEIKKNIRVALATGENLYGIHRFTELMNSNSVDIIQPDLLCCGGLLEAKKIASIAEAHYITVAPHNPLGLISTAASVHHAASINNFVILEWHGDNKKEKSKFINENWYPVNGFFNLPNKPGLGMSLNHKEISKNPPMKWDRGFKNYQDGSPGFL